MHRDTVQVYIYTCIYTCENTSRGICIHIYIYIHSHTCSNMHTYIHTYLLTYGRTDVRTDGRTDGRAGGRADGRTYIISIYIDNIYSIHAIYACLYFLDYSLAHSATFFYGLCRGWLVSGSYCPVDGFVADQNSGLAPQFCSFAWSLHHRHVFSWSLIGEYWSCSYNI